MERTGRPVRTRAPNKRFPVEGLEQDEVDGFGRNNKEGEEVENTRMDKGGGRAKRNDEDGVDTVPNSEGMYSAASRQTTEKRKYSPQEIPCGQCDLIFTDESNRKRHVRQKHTTSETERK